MLRLISLLLIAFAIAVSGYRHNIRIGRLTRRGSLLQQEVSAVDETHDFKQFPIKWLESYVDDAVGESYAIHQSCDDGGNNADSMSGRDKEGTWLLSSSLAGIIERMNNTMANATSEGVQFLADSSFPTNTRLLSKDSYELSILSVPGSGTHAPRRHTSGTILLYKRLWGDCNLRSVVITQNPRDDSVNIRQIKKEVLEEDAVMHRMAGLSRILEANAGIPAAVLELAIFPPSHVDEGFRHAVDRFEIEMSGSVLNIETSVPFRRDFFQYRGEEETTLPGMANSISDDDVEEGPLIGLVGGLSEEVETIARRILLSRSLPKAVFESYGQQHVRGVLMYGPPGCGKTLIARHLAAMVGAPPECVKVVNGPEVFDKFVGEAERNVRELFQEADEAWELLGEKSPLHVIILDELDSIAKARTGGSGSGDGSSVRDSVVNTLLAKLDGVSQRNNILVVGLTNRKDMLDTALLRPGRLEVHIEITAPTAEGRREILDIHTQSLRDNGIVRQEDYVEMIAPMVVARTNGCTGADIAGLVRNAASYSMRRLAQSQRQRQGQGQQRSSPAKKGAERGPIISLEVGGAVVDFTARDRDIRDVALQMQDAEQYRVKALLDDATITRLDFEVALGELAGAQRVRKRDRVRQWLTSMLN